MFRIYISNSYITFASERNINVLYFKQTRIIEKLYLKIFYRIIGLQVYRIIIAAIKHFFRIIRLDVQITQPGCDVTMAYYAEVSSRVAYVHKINPTLNFPTSMWTIFTLRFGKCSKMNLVGLRRCAIHGVATTRRCCSHVQAGICFYVTA